MNLEDYLPHLVLLNGNTRSVQLLLPSLDFVQLCEDNEWVSITDPGTDCRIGCELHIHIFKKSNKTYLWISYDLFDSGFWEGINGIFDSAGKVEITNFSQKNVVKKIAETTKHIMQFHQALLKKRFETLEQTLTFLE